MPAPKSLPDAFVSATHAALFAEEDAARCDVCGAAVKEGDGGRGLYMWTRGSEVRWEEPPLCAECASTIGATALLRAEMEEEDE